MIEVLSIIITVIESDLFLNYAFIPCFTFAMLMLVYSLVRRF